MEVKREGERVCVCACVRVREKDRERERKREREKETDDENATYCFLTKKNFWLFFWNKNYFNVA